MEQRLNVYQTITESFGFAVRQFETCARLSWVPLLLMSLFGYLFPYVALGILRGDAVALTEAPVAKVWQVLFSNFGTIMFEHTTKAIFLGASAFVMFLALGSFLLIPLLRFAATGEQPTDASYDVSFRRPHFRFMIASVLSLVFLVFIALPFIFTLGTINHHIAEATTHTQVAIFPDTDSLHHMEMTTIRQSPWYAGFLPSIVGIGLIASAFYALLRVAPLPFFVAIKSRADSYSSLAKAMSVTKGSNIISFVIILMLLTLMIYPIHFAINVYVLPVVGLALSALLELVGVATRIVGPDGETASWVLPVFLGFWKTFQIFLNLAVMIFIYGVIAGFGGSLFRQSTSD